MPQTLNLASPGSVTQTVPQVLTPHNVPLGPAWTRSVPRCYGDPIPDLRDRPLQRPHIDKLIFPLQRAGRSSTKAFSDILCRTANLVVCIFYKKKRIKNMSSDKTCIEKLILKHKHVQIRNNTLNNITFTTSNHCDINILHPHVFLKYTYV